MHKLTAGQKKNGLSFNGMGHSNLRVHRQGEGGPVLQPSVGGTGCLSPGEVAGLIPVHIHPDSAAQRAPKRVAQAATPCLGVNQDLHRRRTAHAGRTTGCKVGLHVGQQGCRRDHIAPECATSLAEKRALPQPVLQTGTATQGKTSPLPAPALPQTRFASWAPHRGFHSLHKPFPYLPHRSEDMHARHQPSQLSPTL